MMMRSNDREKSASREKMGFVRVGVRKKYYSNGEDAVLMDYILNGSEKVF